MVRPKQVNLVNEEILKKAFPRKVKSKGGLIRVMFVMLVVAFTYIGTQQLSKVVASNLKVTEAKRKMQAAKTKLSQVRSQALDLEKNKNELIKEEALKNQRLEFLLFTSSQETDFANLLTLITTYIPQDLWIDNFGITGSQVEISGTALNPQLITQFINQLNSSGTFNNSHFTSSQKLDIEPQPVHNFKITTEPVWEVLTKGKKDDH